MAGLRHAAAGIDLVIFDCDGVLVDSEALSMAALVDLLAAAGMPVEPGFAYENFLGRSMKAVREILSGTLGLALSEAQLIALRVDLMRRFRDELKPVAGVAEMLPRLKVPYCVASSSAPARIRYALEVTGLLPLLDPHLFSASMVAQGKPAPDLFLHAAREMGAAPGNCLVVEDSPVGIEAARAAGMRVFAFAGGAHAAGANLAARLALTGADFIFADMLQLPRLIAALGAKEEAP